MKRAREVSLSGRAQHTSAVRHKPRWLQGLGALLIAALLVITWWSLGISRSTATQSRAQSVALTTLRTSAEDSSAPSVSEGLLEDLAATLIKQGLSVASRSASLGLQDITDPRLVGRQLGVDAVVTGSVRTVGNRFRVHLEVSSARTGFQIWSETFTVDAAELLGGGKSTVEEIARQMDAALKASR